jgi:hypothetical protein
MKYYVYVSRTKVDMFFSQIPPKVSSRIAAELDIDLKLIQLKLTPTTPEETLFSKLNLVTTFIDKNAEVGTIDEPKEFFRGNLPMKWGPYGDRLVYFGAVTGATVLGLAGSSKHVIGGVGDAAVPLPSMSYAPNLILTAIETTVNSMGDSADPTHPTEPQFPPRPEDVGPRFQLEAVLQASQLMSGPAQQVEFLAKRLLEEPSGEQLSQHLLLGSPLFVALSD